MIQLDGTYECKLDSKGRLPIPSLLIKQLETVSNEPFVIKRSVFESCLEIHPMYKWNEMMQRLGKLNRFVKKNNDFIRMYTSGLKIVSLDTTNRLLIAKDLVEFSGLSKEVVINCSLDIMEVWDKTRYEQSVSLNNVDFASLAEDVMGSFGDE